MHKLKIGAVTGGLLLTIACSAERSRGSAESPPPLPPTTAATNVATPVSHPPITWSDSIEAIEVASIRAADGKVSRSGPELRIKLLDGRTIVFKDDTTRAAAPSLRYAGYLKGIRSHIVHMVPYEGTGVYIVVDDSTGDSTTVSGVPVPSPDGKRFALTSMAGDEDTDASVIEVWRMDGRKPENEFSHDTSHEPWEPSDIVWRDSATVDFTKNTHSDPSEPYIKTPGRLKRTGTTWTSTQPTASESAESFEPDGYYISEDGVTVDDYAFVALQVSTAQYYYNGQSHDQPKKVEPPEANLTLRSTRDSQMAMYRCSGASIIADSLSVDCPHTTIGDVTINGHFLAKTGRYWNTLAYELKPTVLLIARVVVKKNGKIVVDCTHRFTYTSGD